MKSKYLKFTDKSTSVKRRVNDKLKTKVVHVNNLNNGDFLGWITWRSSFRNYAFTPYGEAAVIFDANCLHDISEKIKALNEQYKRKKLRDEKSTKIKRSKAS